MRFPWKSQVLERSNFQERSNPKDCSKSMEHWQSKERNKLTERSKSKERIKSKQYSYSNSAANRILQQVVFCRMPNFRCAASLLISGDIREIAISQETYTWAMSLSSLLSGQGLEDFTIFPIVSADILKRVMAKRYSWLKMVSGWNLNEEDHFLLSLFFNSLRGWDVLSQDGQIWPE
jgi:hypothetical protein